ncbi:MAG TPA: ankyrin repeat domain-containing protein [Pyrinomonadaceae bacterium]
MSDLTLIEAVKNGDPSAIAELSAGGADINEQDEHGWTALNWASGKGNVETIRLLLEKGADVTRVGRDQRTPYLIALAGGHAEAAKLLKEAEEGSEGEKISRPERKYCRAYQQSELEQFPGWHEQKIKGSVEAAGQIGDEGDDAMLYLHQNFRVTASMWENENIVFDEISPEWKNFCANVLKFKAQDDLDLIVSFNQARDGAAA